jgi:hypothetical protein
LTSTPQMFAAALISGPHLGATATRRRPWRSTVVRSLTVAEPQLRITLSDGGSHEVPIEGGDPENQLIALLHGHAPYEGEWIRVQARGLHYVHRSAVVHVTLTGLADDEPTFLR